MFIDKKYQLEVLTRDASHRRDADTNLLSCVHVMSLNGQHVAWASNGFLLAVVPVDLEDEDVTGYIQGEAWARIRRSKLGRAAITDTHVVFRDGWIAPRVAPPVSRTKERAQEHTRLITGMRRVIDTYAPSEQGYPVFGLNPEALVLAAKATGLGWGLKIHPGRDKTSAMLLNELRDGSTPPTPPFALLMPTLV